MKSPGWIVLAGLALVGTAAAAPATGLLASFAGQVCHGHTGQSEVRYALRNRNGQWAVRIVYAASSAKPVADWHNATADGATLTFPGTHAGQITLTATGPHALSMRAEVGIRSYGPYLLTCVSPARR